MRKGLLISVFVFASLWRGGASAQSANMAITLRDALTFTVNQPIFTAVNQSKDKNDNGIQTIASDHISVVSSRGYVVKAISGSSDSAPGLQGLVRVTPQIGTTNKGNTHGLVLESDVPLPPSTGNPVTVITAANCSWNGLNSTNKFNIAYRIGNQYAYIDNKATPSIIPVIFTVIQP